MPIALPHLLLTGAPGVGKTTVLRKLADRLDSGSLGGFYTEEMRERGERRGFRLVTFDGAERVIAHVDFPKAHQVGKYGVDVAALDETVGAALALRPEVKLYLVDEIGKMECLSERFVAAMRRLLDSRKPLVATIAQRGEGFIADVKRRSDCELWTVTHANRDALPQQLAEHLAPLGANARGTATRPRSPAA
jgi:nucleoside-triphosphatase